MRAAALLFAATAVLNASCDRPKGTPKEPDGGPIAASPLSADSGGDASRTIAAPAPPSPSNVIVISVDSLRADMPWAGYERPIAPRLSALHAKSTAYTRAYATSSFTSKSLAGLLTGRYPSELARTGSFFTRYLASKDFLCVTLTAAGSPCIGGHAHAYFGPGLSGYESGFSEWRLVPGIAFDYQSDPYVTSDKLAPLAITMLDEVSKKDRPFFAWFHFMDPHDAYKPHAESPHFGKRPRDLYDEEVFFTDQWIGRLLDHIEAQPWAKRTVIVVTADHGEAFGEHGMTRHAHELWEELVHVPLFFYVPGAKPRAIDVPRSHVDLAATFAELVGQPAWPSGTSLVRELEGGEAPPRDVICDLPEDEYNERRRALVHGKAKLIAFGKDARFSLFDLEQDPGESRDLFRSNPSLAAEMKARYEEASKRIVDKPPVGGIPKHER